MKLLSAIVCVACTVAIPAAEAAVFVYNTNLSGLNEFPPNASPGTGTGIVTYDDTAHTLRVQVSFSGLLGTTTAAHIHAATALPGIGTAGVATTTPNFAGFPGGVTSGTYDNTLNLTLASSYNPAYVTANGGSTAGAEAALAQALAAGRSYLNVHTTFVPSGEIRGFLTAAPEPSTWMLLISGFGVVGALMRKAQRSRRFMPA